MVTKSIVPFAALLFLSGCNEATAPPTPATVTEAEAGQVFDAALSAWQSMDAAKMKALYAPDFAGFDFSLAPLITDRAEWDKVEDAFAAAKVDSLDITAKKIHLLGPDAFVVDFYADATSTALPQNNGGIRCTDVFHRDAAGAWLIVAEHCSVPPEAPDG